jgi:adenylate cyclase
MGAAAQLSERERQVAERYVAGQSYKEIARALGISPATIRTHANAVYRKLEVTSRIELLHRLRAPERTIPAALPLPDKPSLAVLPFDNLSGDPAQEYFADGMVEEITTALSKISGLFVIARNSSFTYKGRAVDVTQVGRELGVRYVLEGSVRKAGERVRITGQLIDAASGNHLWADRFDGVLEDIFALQDRVAEAVAGVIEPTLRRAEIERARRKPTGSLDAYDLYLRALALMLTLVPERNTEAIALVDRALELDPDYATAHAVKAWCHSDRCLRGWAGIDEKVEQAAAVRAARRALSVGGDDPTALALAGFVVAMLDHDIEAGLRALRTSIRQSPNSALALGFEAWIHCFAGDYAAALDSAERAERLSPVDPMRRLPLLALAYAHFLSGRADLAIEPAGRAINASPTFELPYCIMIASQIAFGREAAARETAARLLAAVPSFRISRRRIAGFRDTKRYGEFLAALERVGLPE